MSKHIVVLSGSPRKDGNTVRLADAFIEGAKAAGKEISLFRVAGLQIGGCRGCGERLYGYAIFSPLPNSG